jgi:release factor glutamine methyltransferase
VIWVDTLGMGASSTMPYDALVATLRAAGCVYAEDEARVLTTAAADDAELAVWTDRRVAGEPLELVVGFATFCGIRVAVAPGVFVPRQRSSALVRAAATGLAAGDVAIDLCCGTGALGLALQAAVPGLEVYAADIDPDAVACARRNLPAGRVFQGDLYAALPEHLRGRVTVLVVNAPYVPTDEIALMPPEARDHEHRVALDGGADGLHVQRGVIAGAGDWMTPGGRLLIETSLVQAPLTAALMTAAGLAADVVRDDDVDGTVVVGLRPRS